MSFLTKMLAQTSSLSLTSADGWAGWPGVVTQAGVPVSADSALKLSAAWACVRLLSETIASLPLMVYRRLSDGGREEATNHPLFDLLHDRPNDQQTAIEFRQMLTLHALQRGNGLARIVSGPRGFVDQLIPIHPDHVTIEVMTDGTLRYHVNEPGRRAEILLDEDVLHLKGLSLDGKIGVSVITYARESMGLALAAGDYGARYFKNGARSSGVVTHPNRISPEAVKRLRSEIAEQHTGASQWKPLFFEEGMTWKDVSFNNKDSQFLELLDHQAEDIARFYGVPPHMIGLTSKVTSWGSGIEQLGIAFVTYTLLPWLKRWEQAITRDLILAPRVYFVEHVVAALLRGDLTSRYTAYKTGVEMGWLSVNDVRRKENENPIPGGDSYGPAAPVTALVETRPGGHYAALTREAAGRVLRKEAAALGRAAKRAGDDAEAWAAAVRAFYAEHAAYVAEALCMSADMAGLYVAQQVDDLLRGGPALLEHWEAARIEALAELAMEAL